MRLRDFRRLPVLRSRLHPGEPAQQDLIYSPLLFNQLADRAAQRLALRLWQALRANGRMIITNIMRSCPDVALFECFGGWRVFDRSPGEMAQLIQSIPPQQIATLDLAEDPQRMIVSLILSKVRA